MSKLHWRDGRRYVRAFSVCYVTFFFFFQAEDGIRDVAVTGVQTCALPISHHDLWQRAELTVCVVSNDRGHAERVLQEADRLVEAADGARIVDTATSFF